MLAGKIDTCICKGEFCKVDNFVVDVRLNALISALIYIEIINLLLVQLLRLMCTGKYLRIVQVIL